MWLILIGVTLATNPSDELLPSLSIKKNEAVVTSPFQNLKTVIAPAEVSANAALEDRFPSSSVDSYAAQPSGTPEPIIVAAPSDIDSYVDIPSGAPEEIVAAESSPIAAHSFESDGYHYRTVKRIRLRQN